MDKTPTTDEIVELLMRARARCIKGELLRVDIDKMLTRLTGKKFRPIDIDKSPAERNG